MYFRFLDNAFESGSDDEERGASALVSMDLGVSALASIGSRCSQPPSQGIIAIPHLGAGEK
jgi:hypothetical protein